MYEDLNSSMGSNCSLKLAQNF